MNNFFLVIPTRERKTHLLNLLKDLIHFSNQISQCVIVDQSRDFLGNNFDYKAFPYSVSIIKGDSNKGVNHSRNLALSKYKNEKWLFFLDDDLRVEPAELDRLMNYVQGYTYDVIVPGINETRQRSSERLEYDNLIDSLCKPQSYEAVSNRIIVSSGLSVVSAKYFFKAGDRFDETFTFWGDDWDFGLRLYKAGATIKYVPEINFTHLKVSEGGQRSYKEKLNEKRIKKELQFYLIKKHFGKGVLNEIFFLDMLKNIYKVKLKGIYNCYLGFRNIKKGDI